MSQECNLLLPLSIIFLIFPWNFPLVLSHFFQFLLYHLVDFSHEFLCRLVLKLLVPQRYLVQRHYLQWQVADSLQQVFAQSVSEFALRCFLYLYQVVCLADLCLENLNYAFVLLVDVHYVCLSLSAHCVLIALFISQSILINSRTFSMGKMLFSSGSSDKFRPFSCQSTFLIVEIFCSHSWLWMIFWVRCFSKTFCWNVPRPPIFCFGLLSTRSFLTQDLWQNFLVNFRLTNGTGCTNWSE